MMVSRSSTVLKRSVVCTFILLLLTMNYAFAEMPVIKADKQYFDFEHGVHVLSGNVRIEHSGRVVTAGEARTNMIEVWASGGVTFSQNDIAFSGNNVYVYFPREKVDIDGNIDFTRPGLHITSDKVEYNWDSKIAVFTGHVTINQNGTATNADSASYNINTNSFL